MTEPEPEDNYQRIEDLEEENQSLREESTRVRTENDRLREEVKKLEKLLRGKARSATPFPHKMTQPAYWRTTVTARQAKALDASYAFTVMVFVPTSNGMAETLHC